jgi:hypothetical protein
VDILGTSLVANLAGALSETAVAECGGVRPNRDLGASH